jgi:hypothetical protein
VKKSNANYSLPPPRLDPEALEARFALRLAARLSEGSDAVSHDVSERLRVARDQALERARAARRVNATAQAAAVVATGSGSSGSALLGGGPSTWWMRLASLLPFVALVAGLLLIQQIQQQEEIDTAAEIDADLLSDDLPPDAYDDPGFREFLTMPGPAAGRE